MKVSTTNAYVAVTAAASTGVAHPLNSAPSATTGTSSSHLASQLARRVSRQSIPTRWAPVLGAWLTPQMAVRTTRRIPGTIPPRNIALMSTPAITP